MIEFLTNLSEILKLVMLIIFQTGCILILISLPFIMYYGSQISTKEERTILRITFKDKN